jgi:hypothetical protein
MDLFDFQYASALALAYSVLKWLLMGLVITTSRLWNHTVLAIALAMGMAIIGAGALFKIEHWKFDDELLLLGPIVVLGTYARWFSMKEERRLLDYLKLAWLVGALSTIAAIVIHRQLIKPLTGITEALFWAMALLLVYQRWIRRPESHVE